TYARYHSRALGVVVLPVGMAMLLYAASVSSDIKPLVPALQNNVLMLHITVGVMAYSCFTVAFGAGVLYLAQERLRRPSLPSLETLDEIGFSAVAFGFPFMVLLLILGAYWANAAWGRYWGWDPKETAALVTLLIYAGYLHTRALRNWRGRRGAVLLLIGFASVMLTYFGNYFLTGLHAYR
ncbi:MAG: c-type cytochrome biogenesis protein CcsB, partial [Dehalococcoidia bacterium]